MISKFIKVSSKSASDECDKIKCPKIKCPKCPHRSAAKSLAPSKPKPAKGKLDKSVKKKKKNLRIEIVDTQERTSESEAPVNEDSRGESHSEWPMFAIRNSSRRKTDELMVPLIINNIPRSLELDTSAMICVCDPRGYVEERVRISAFTGVPCDTEKLFWSCYTGGG